MKHPFDTNEKVRFKKMIDDFDDIRNSKKTKRKVRYIIPASILERAEIKSLHEDMRGLNRR